MTHQLRTSLAVIILAAVQADGLRAEPTEPLDAAERSAIEDKMREQAERLTAQIKDDPKNVDLYSQRGDALFFLGEFKKAVDDFDRMVKLRPSLEASHWRRGIAYFFAGAVQTGRGAV